MHQIIELCLLPKPEAFAAEQKIRELKKILLKSKIIEKRSGKGFKPNELIKKATNNLNKTRSAQQKTASVPIK